MSTESRLPEVHVVGDSISLDYGPILEGYLAGVLTYSRKPPENADPDTANGRDSNDVVAYLRSLPAGTLARHRYLMVNCGLHDIKRDLDSGELQVDIARYEANLRAIVQLAAGAGVRLVWVRTTPIDEEIHNNRITMPFRRFAADLAAYNRVADSVMLEARAEVIDLHRFTALFGGEAFRDHVHFTEEVRRAQAAFLAGSLCQINARSQHAG